MKETFLAVINPAAGGGKCGKLAGPALEQLRSRGINIEAAVTHRAGHAVEIVREAYSQGLRRFIAVGGDGTSYEMVNGLFPESAGRGRPTLGFLPLGTGNSFLRDFTDRGVEYAADALVAGRTRPCDVVKLTHRTGVLYYINLLSLGFAADVAALTNRNFKPLGQWGYLLGVLTCLLRLDRRPFPLSIDGDGPIDERRCLFLAFSNSKYTGGKMMIAPNADAADGYIEYVRWGPIGRMGLIVNLHKLFDGSHIRHPMASRHAVRRVDFRLERAVDVMVDGEVLTLHCERLEILPSGLDVLV